MISEGTTNYNYLFRRGKSSQIHLFGHVVKPSTSTFSQMQFRQLRDYSEDFSLLARVLEENSIWLLDHSRCQPRSTQHRPHARKRSSCLLTRPPRLVTGVTFVKLVSTVSINHQGPCPMSGLCLCYCSPVYFCTVHRTIGDIRSFCWHAHNMRHSPLTC